MRVLLPADSVSVSAMTHHDGLIVWTTLHENGALQLGGAITLRDGSDCTIAACGITVSMALEAAESLASEGISCRVIDVYSIKPINKKA